MPSLCEPTALLSYYFVCGNTRPDGPFFELCPIPMQSFSASNGFETMSSFVPINKTVQKTLINTNRGEIPYCGEYPGPRFADKFQSTNQMDGISRADEIKWLPVNL